MGVPVTIPNTFQNGPGNTADAGQVNANFTALQNALAKAIDGADGDTVNGILKFAAQIILNASGTAANSNAEYLTANYIDGAGTGRSFTQIAGDQNSLGGVDTWGIWWGSSQGSPTNSVFSVDKNGKITTTIGAGVQAVSGGYKMQSGAVSVGATANAQGLYTATVTFPVAFTSNPIVLATGTNLTGSTESVTVWNISTTGFTVYSKVSNETIEWAAFG